MSTTPRLNELHDPAFIHGLEIALMACPPAARSTLVERLLKTILDDYFPGIYPDDDRGQQLMWATALTDWERLAALLRQEVRETAPEYEPAT